MHPAHFQAQRMSLNVFCSCGPSGRPIQINLPDCLCLLDKTWHIGFFIPSQLFKFCYLERFWFLSDYSLAVTKFLPTDLNLEVLKPGAIFSSTAKYFWYNYLSQV